MGVGVVGDGKPHDSGVWIMVFKLDSPRGTLSKSADNTGTIFFQADVVDATPMLGDEGGCGEYRKTTSCHFSNFSLAM